MYEDPANSHKGKTLDSAAAKWPECASMNERVSARNARMGRKKWPSIIDAEDRGEKYLFKTHVNSKVSLKTLMIRNR